MTAPRADFAGTLLPNGKVLLVGGQTTAADDTATAEVFDPVTQSFTSVAPMKTPRNGHTATLLPNGKVLVVGGSGRPGGDGLASAEIYDPAANTWSPAASMSQPRVHHAAALMANGRVIVVGGNSSPGPVEIYDPGTNTWTSASLPSNEPRPFGPTATALAGGRVMMVGGANGSAQTVNGDVWFYDPATQQMSFDQWYPLRSGVNWATAAPLPNGQVLIAGGEDSTNPSGAESSTDLFDPVSDKFAIGPPMNVGHCHHTMTVLNSGLLLVAGGRCGNQDSIAVSELFDPTTMRWSAAGALQDPRGFHVAVLLPDGRVLACGGIFPGGTIANSTELYTP